MGNWVPVSSGRVGTERSCWWTLLCFSEELFISWTKFYIVCLSDLSNILDPWTQMSLFLSFHLLYPSLQTNPVGKKIKSQGGFWCRFRFGQGWPSAGRRVRAARNSGLTYVQPWVILLGPSLHWLLYTHFPLRKNQRIIWLGCGSLVKIPSIWTHGLTFLRGFWSLSWGHWEILF